MNEIEKNLWRKAQEYFALSALYKEKYKSSPQDFSSIPLLRKQDLLADQAKYPPFGSNVSVTFAKVSRIHRTSGTSTKPLLLTLTQRDLEQVIATGRKAFLNVGLTEDDTVINCMNYCMWMGGLMDHQSLESTGAAVIPYGVGHTENLVELLYTIKNVCIHSTPSYLSVIERVAREKYNLDPRELHISKALLGGEGGASDCEYRRKMEDTFGMRIYDANYGMSEVMSIVASQHREKAGLVFVAGETLYPELLVKRADGGWTISNQNIKDGMIGELVLSNLKKESQPLLRYGTGDILEIIHCDEDIPVKNFSFRVLGRSDDMIVVKGINFYPASIRDIVAKFPMGTGNYQIKILNQSTVDYVRLLVELRDVAGIDGLEDFRQKIVDDIRKKYFVLCDVFFVEKLAAGKNKIGLVERCDSFDEM